MIGQLLGRYRIDAPLGAGGMGVVYRAYDTELHRPVAVKILGNDLGEEAARERLLREARAASALNHPHICTVHEVGRAGDRTFIVMEYVEGQALSERLAGGALLAETVLTYGGQIAAALAHAHARGIVHCDLKPANIVITSEGHAKVLDFGLAKRLAGTALAEITTLASVAGAGTMAGTLAYMAPEQLRGEPADGRSDVWALGLVLYEMAAGMRPFAGRTVFELSSAILSQPLPPLPAAVSGPLRDAIERCLDKDPARRYRDAGEVHAALEAFRGAAGAPPLPDRSVAVLPFLNLSADPANEYFSDGVTEAILAALSRIEGVKVISRTSVMRYKGTARSVGQIAAELGVATVLEGSVQREGGRVRITAQLIDARADAHLWAETYDRDRSDLFAIQSDVASRIAAALRPRLSASERRRLASRPTGDLEAYELYLKGRYLWNQRTEVPVRRAIQYFEAALARDPGFALAQAAIADCHIVLSSWLGSGSLDTTEGYETARAAALEALRLDASLGEAHAALAAIAHDYDWDFKEAEEAYRRAVRLNPGYATAHHWFGEFLAAIGRVKEGIAEIEIALELDPLSPATASALSWAYMMDGRHEAACRQLLEVLEIDSDFLHARFTLGVTYLCMGRSDDAILELERAGRLSDQQLQTRAALACAYARAGRIGDAEAVLAELEASARGGHASPYWIGVVHAALGRQETALQWLEEAYRTRMERMAYLKADPFVAPLEGHPLFASLLERIGYR